MVMVLIYAKQMQFVIVFLFRVQSVSINEFLKSAEGEYYRPGGRGRGRGRGRGGYAGNSMNSVQAPSIEDAGHFPSLGGK